MARIVLAFCSIHALRDSAEGERPIIPASLRASRIVCSGIRRFAFHALTVCRRSLQNLPGAARTVAVFHSVFTEDELARERTIEGEAETVEAAIVTVVSPVGGVFVCATLAHLPPPQGGRGLTHNHSPK